jgi:D-sedoheptulose 7-phosphate isomerase
MKFFEKYFKDLESAINKVENTDLHNASLLVHETDKKGGKVIIVGNGGSAAIASHVSVDFTKAAGIRAVNFNESDLITCFANDYGYENWVKEALNAYADSGDLLILISSSGQSANIVNAANRAFDLGLKLITLSGFSETNPLRSIGDINFWIDSDNYNYVEMTHHIWLLAICDYIIASNQV